MTTNHKKRTEISIKTIKFMTSHVEPLALAGNPILSETVLNVIEIEDALNNQQPQTEEASNYCQESSEEEFEETDFSRKINDFQKALLNLTS